MTFHLGSRLGEKNSRKLHLQARGPWFGGTRAVTAGLPLKYAADKPAGCLQ